MKSEYKQPLFANLFLVALIFFEGALLLDEIKEFRHRTGLLTERLDTYAELVHTALSAESPSISSSSWLSLLPTDIRLTLISHTGKVFYDNYLSSVEVNLADDHSRRPEIREASRKGVGINKRLSASTHQEYLYYAKRYDTCFVRVALPYSTVVVDFFEVKPNQVALYCTSIAFIIIVFLLRSITNHFERLIKKDGVSVTQKEHSSVRTTTKQKSSQLKQEMTGQIAHELRTPMVSLRGYCNTLLHDVALPKDAYPYVIKAYGQVLILSGLIRDMGTLSKIGGNRRNFYNTSVHLLPFLHNLIDSLEDNLKNQRVEIECVDLEEVILMGNNTIAYSIFRNLIDNVVKHAGLGTHVVISKQAEDDDFYTILFTDNGVGIEEEALKELFQRFNRTDENWEHDAECSGIGLAIVSNIIRLLGGGISANNCVEGGLQFVLHLPRYKPK
ncbi:MAG: HAMP domain-containing histidine kinase [Tannerellaceae bacterium]|jgi:signal transduction histidine kinase|nr:HAMP domain-containing histidine kinase [Tannerellaceae bacterium]